MAWEVRYDIALGATIGLEYLHYGCASQGLSILNLPRLCREELASGKHEIIFG